MNRLLGCNVYVSEGHNLKLVRQLEALCKQHPRAVLLAHTFVDAPYNRTGFTLAATGVTELAATVAAVAHAALAAIDLRAHSATHPRLGVLDHVSLHPLGPQASLQLAGQAAAAIGQQLAAPPLQLPVYWYGAAHPTGRRLPEIRRQLGYFKPIAAAAPHQAAAAAAAPERARATSGSDTWRGSLARLQLSSYPPDAGPTVASAAAGVVTIGAVPWVTNFNVPLRTDAMAAARAVARAVSSRGGGPAGVEAMALQHAPGVVEIATNLTAYDWRGAGGGSSVAGQRERGSTAAQQAAGGEALRAGAGPEEVQAAVAAHAAALGLPPPGAGYLTSKTPAELLQLAAQHLGG